LKKYGHNVIWNDCLAQGMDYDGFINFIKQEKPDIIAFETKTPVVKQHWEIISKLKTIDQRLKTALFGDHVTALPEESMQNSQVDYVLTGGDYDFLLLNLCNHLDQQAELDPGIYYRDNGQIKNSGKFQLNHDLNSLPFIDRELTKWQDYAFKNGNYKLTPGTYIMSGRDCWWGKCSFCSWPTLYPQFRTRNAENVLDEIEILVEKYKVREIMDDTGCFPAGVWLRSFCDGLIKRGLNKKNFYFDCNMRFGALTAEDFSLMKKANFRLLLFGLESANQPTLDRLNKNLKAERIIEDCKTASKAGLYPHITIMFGYPWESYEDALKTLELGSWLLKKGYAYTMQATMVIPYPGTPLFDECKAKGWLKTLNWNDYDMKRPVMRSPIPDKALLELVQGMYKVAFSPEFILRKIASLRSPDDIQYAIRATKKVLGHIFDFRS
ncbi:MAG: B12-binding domain-containing radical SAM protein, partial [Candidatus Omnitrophica bacterium]|nr:B12-binding domain-containing radical SAM protein [Candidatus Omnitrophota bacterium]